MRVRLVGYEGERPPVPGVTPVVPIDPGPSPTPDPSTIPDPQVIMFNNDAVFHPLDYINLGYNHFDVMCIGGAGGQGGGFHYTRPNGAIARHYGGAGGGGGVHRVKGRLILLPTDIPITIGRKGANGVFNSVAYPQNPFITPVLLTDGSDGGASTFGTICKASGGKGGRKRSDGTYGTTGVSYFFGGYVPGGQLGGQSLDGFGGAGGKGGQTTPGGGGSGGTNSTNGADGTWDGTIGSGGGGGYGGYLSTPDHPYVSGDVWTHLTNVASGGYWDIHGNHGGKGAYLSSDANVSGEGANLGGYFDTDFWHMFDAGGGTFDYYLDHIGTPILGGPGGGATLFPINGALLQWGSSAGGVNASISDGVIAIRLSYVIT